MHPKHLKELIEGKRQASEPLSTEDRAKGFKGWYSSKCLPHFDSPGTQQFLTFRLEDSMPAELRHQWEASLHLQDKLENQKRIEIYLDRGLGACHLRNPRVAEIVQGALWHKDGISYRLLAWALMPNHVHVLFETWQVPMGKLVKDWKGYTAKEANKILGTSGAFWADDYFDRYIRDQEHFRRVIRYVENNPVKAGLASEPKQWPWSSAHYRGQGEATQHTLSHPGAQRFPPPPLTG